MKTLLMFVLLTTPLALFGQTPVHPSVVLTCTLPSNLPDGSFVNFYRGTTAGGEATTPVNPTGQTICGYTDLAVKANKKYYYTAKICAVAVDTGNTVCGPTSNEASATVPLLASDLPAIVDLSGLGK